MQNYEEFISEISGTESAVKNAALASVKQEKAIAKNLETGNLTEARKSLSSLREAIAQLTEQTEALQAGDTARLPADWAAILALGSPMMLLVLAGMFITERIKRRTTRLPGEGKAREIAAALEEEDGNKEEAKRVLE